jgi:hypothetical protein
MEKEFYSLELREDNRLTKIFRILFGLLCIAVALFWVIYNMVSVKSDSTQWVTVAFLILFGAFQIYAGLGFAGKFIEFGKDNIRLRKNSVLPPISIPALKIKRIEIYPLKFQIFFSEKEMILYRFGISDTEKINIIKDALERYAEAHNLVLEIKNEEIL